MNTIRFFWKHQPVLCIAAVLTLISMFFVPPSLHYFDYINANTLILLFALMGAVAGLRMCGVFKKMASVLTQKCNSSRRLAFFMMTICFIMSMFITNDVALLTFVPITLLIYSESSEKSCNLALIWTVILETVAANLGSMLLPTGNPQNIYICSFYSMTPSELIQVLLPYGIIAYALLCLSLLLLPKCQIVAKKEKATSNKFSWKTTICCILVFIISLLTVAGYVPSLFCFISAIVLLAIANPRIFIKIDYMLLATFVCFFIFTGNLGSIDQIRNLISQILTDHELTISILSSQVFSNVPAAILLSGFTNEAKLLLTGVNLGGLGTPIASMASLISFQLYSNEKHELSGKYMVRFLIYNFLLLAILYVVSLIL